MVLVLFFLISITLIVVLSATLSLQIVIKNFKYYKEEKVKKKTNKDYEVIVYAYILKKIKIFKYKLNNQKIAKDYFKNINKKIDYSILKSFISNNVDNYNIKFIELENLNLNLEIGTESVILTSGIVAFSNILISLFLPRIITNYDNKKYFYEVKPVYIDKYKINLFLESTIRIKLFSLAKALKNYSRANQKTNQSINNENENFLVNCLNKLGSE